MGMTCARILSVLVTTAIMACVVPPDDSAADDDGDLSETQAQLSVTPFSCTNLELVTNSNPDHAAREDVAEGLCSTDTNMHFFINLQDTLCDNRAAVVSWTISDIFGRLASGSHTNGKGCNSSDHFELTPETRNGTPSQFRVQTSLQACNSFGCSDLHTYTNVFNHF
jgi:hypothetical protein